ncbi:acetyl-CoA synthetase-like protein [Trametes coccinea BRFM310]|uniref:Acetyl-CoA synthetase-like protein n=1 Tax=Trametes coccinea (strain BRFM310) TaxID=1353009 RepID=A0A1Y2IHB8_TRAC3|nr:acetyl-CoA synthetase-like protein [Trametes coccinea BRFM310]
MTVKSKNDEIPTIYGDGGPLAPIPDDLTIPQFLFDTHHPLGGEGLHLRSPAWFIDDATGREVTGDQLRARTWGLANAMHLRWGLMTFPAVCVYGPNHLTRSLIDYPVVIWATHRLGGIVTGANPSYTEDELVYQIRTAKATAIFVHPDSLQVGLAAARTAGIPDDRVVLFDNVPGDKHKTVTDLVLDGLAKPRSWVEPRLKPGEGKTKLALLFFSSGTTGRPKAVMIPHYAVIANVVQMKQYADRYDADKPLDQKKYRPGDRMLGVLPFYHIYGVVVSLHYFVFTGGTLVIVGRFNFENMLKSIQRYKIGHLALVPPMIVLLCKHPAVKNYDLRSVKMLTCGAAPLSAELTQQVARLLPNSGIGQGYGMTETCTTFSFPQLFMRVGTPGSAGVLIPGTGLRILKADGTWGGYNETGQLVVTGPSMAIGYLDNPQATAETFKDGWVYTGDEGYVNEMKELFIIDRIKELIKVRGFQVAPAELEGLLLDHPDVADVCVVGAPDEYSGELPFAFIALKEDARARIAKDPKEADKVRDDILKFVMDRKTQYKWLAGIEFVDVVPKNPSGKLLRRLLRDKLKELMKEGKIKLVQPGAKTRAKL